MFVPLRRMLSGLTREGNLTFVDSRGAAYCFGDGTGVPVRARVLDRRTEWRLALDPELAAGEAYVTGRLVIEAGTLYDFLSLMMKNAAASPFPHWVRSAGFIRWLTRRFAQFNPLPRSRRNVIHHYDIDPTIFDLFLDSDRQYSCAYFEGVSDLERAQMAKKRHIAAKLNLKPGLRVLDIGSGWGGLGLYLAKLCDVDVTGITLSEEQLAASRIRALSSGADSKVKFEPLDYREIRGTYDRIVSVGMFEHVGITHYKTFFRTIATHLTDDGVALIHTIGRLDRPAATNPFVARYIFPGGYIPALSEVVSAIEHSGLMLTDVEVLRLHYAKTLRCWRERFEKNRTMAVAIAGEEFCRMWEFYLAGSEAGFRHQGLVVFQIQLTNSIDSLPTTRNYMLETERRLSFKDRGRSERPRLAS